jgi:hypothetical protein
MTSIPSTACPAPGPAELKRHTVLLVFASLGIAALVTLTSLLGLLTSWPYQQETQNWALQAQGQDVGKLIAVVVLVVSTIRVRHGSFRATQLWIGTLFYLLYADVVYTFAVHFGRLFLVYVAILGLLVYSLIAALRASVRPSRYPLGAARVFAAWVLIGTGALFTLLWLTELVPASISGELSPSTEAAGLIVNPVHVIDLSVLLPGMIFIGVLALRRNLTGLFLTLPALVFTALMGLSIIAAMVLIAVSGDASALVLMVMVAVVVGASVTAAVATLASCVRRGCHAQAPTAKAASSDDPQKLQKGRMMHALVVLESLWGNTEQIAREIAAGIEEERTDVADAASAPNVLNADVDLLVVGGPTHAFSMSTATTRESAKHQGAEHVPTLGIREWVDAHQAPHRAILVATFDTRVVSPPLPGSAAKKAMKLLVGLGYRPLVKPETFHVHGYSGPVADGELERAKRWGAELAKLVH